ncbi:MULTISPECIES: dephospho-CoA kinase [unclassified Halomonas]|uniref:dephospho-CoA kinase n=1 Tax=unclassified Halomonas TaxID=2609666 RepID=UPI0024698F4C|nr:MULTISPECIES: dephospho-CoA kinase [unclassified Halomonas]
MIIGVTGGIASGKSTVARAFAARGIPWVDADEVAREIVAPGEPALAEIAEHFGREVLASDGGLDRRALREIVFADAEARRQLERITHPRIHRRLEAYLERLQAQGAPYVLLVSPLLFESGQDAMVDRCLVIDVPKETQIARTAARDGVDEAQARAIIAAQMSREERLARADDVIDNSADAAGLDAQVTELDRQYRAAVGLPPGP